MKPIFLTVIAVLLAACSDSPPLIEAGADPSDPKSRVPQSRYVPVTAGTVDYKPIGPKPWAERNQSVAPQAEGK